jgi:hypothetical protein
MTAATKTTASPTATAKMLERLSAVDPAPDYGHMNELLPWLQASRVGAFELPAECLDLAAQGLHLADLTRAHVRPLEHRTRNVDRLLRGASVADIFDADDAVATTRARWERGSELLVAAAGHLAAECGGVFAPIRDSLIRNEMREAVATLLAEAGTVAERLRRFAPDFPPALLESANEAELKLWRRSRQLQRDLETLIAAWQTSWHAATHIGTPVVKLEFNPARAGGWFAWTAPDDVQDESLRLGHDTEVLRVATAGSSYRLLSPDALMPLIAQLEAALPDGAHMPAWQMVRRGVADGH